MIRPTMVTALVMQSIEYFNMVTLIYVLTAGGPFNATQTLSLAAYQNGFDYWHMDIAAAYSIIIFLLNIVFSLFYVSNPENPNDKLGGRNNGKKEKVLLVKQPGLDFLTVIALSQQRSFHCFRFCGGCPLH